MSKPSNKAKQQVTNIILKTLFKKPTKPVLYIDFQPELIANNITISNDDLSQILDLAEAKDLVVKDFSVEGGMCYRIHKKAILLLDKHGSYLKYLSKAKREKSINEKEQKSVAPNFTTTRQVLAMHYLLDELKVTKSADKTEIARFIQFLTSKETGTAKIKDTTIYKRVKNPFPRSERTLQSDLQFIRSFYEKLGMSTIVAKINKEIGNK